ncbi:MAG: siderophore-interacting protein, partial [Microbacteriaceae bacterium]
NLTVTRTRRVSPSFTRVTLSGEDLAGFTSIGPADHAKLFFPSVDDGVPVARDYTPRAFRAAAGDSPAELDFDFVHHPSGGPAAAWASAAEPGDGIVAVGPRASRLPPSGARRFVLVADETALPALARWIELVPPDAEVLALVELSIDSDAGYLDPEHVNRAKVCWLRKGDGALERAVRALGILDDDTYVWAAGEATSLIPIRRYLRNELGLHQDQYSVDGYWKHGVEGLDHHAPLDPTDPD